MRCCTDTRRAFLSSAASLHNKSFPVFPFLFGLLKVRCFGSSFAPRHGSFRYYKAAPRDVFDPSDLSSLSSFFFFSSFSWLRPRAVRYFLPPIFWHFDSLVSMNSPPRIYTPTSVGDCYSSFMPFQNVSGVLSLSLSSIVCAPSFIMRIYTRERAERDAIISRWLNHHSARFFFFSFSFLVEPPSHSAPASVSLLYILVWARAAHFQESRWSWLAPLLRRCALKKITTPTNQSKVAQSKPTIYRKWIPTITSPSRLNDFLSCVFIIRFYLAGFLLFYFFFGSGYYSILLWLYNTTLLPLEGDLYTYKE